MLRPRDFCLYSQLRVALEEKPVPLGVVAIAEVPAGRRTSGDTKRRFMHRRGIGAPKAVRISEKLIK